MLSAIELADPFYRSGTTATFDGRQAGRMPWRAVLSSMAAGSGHGAVCCQYTLPRSRAGRVVRWRVRGVADIGAVRSRCLHVPSSQCEGRIFGE